MNYRKKQMIPKYFLAKNKIHLDTTKMKNEVLIIEQKKYWITKQQFKCILYYKISYQF